MTETEIERLVVRLVGDSTSYQSMMNQAAGAVSKVQDSVQKHTSGLLGLDGKVRQVMGTMISWGTLMGGLVGVGSLMGTMYFGVKLASEAEQAEVAFTSLMKSETKAKSFLDDLFKFAASTPFEFPQLKTAAKSLLSAGVAAKDVIPIMKNVGDVTSAMGTGSEGVQRATYALMQMKQAGRILGGDMMQLTNAGIPAQKILAAALGKSTEEVMHMAQGGHLGAKEMNLFFDAMKSGKGMEMYLGGMEKQSKTLEGVFSTLKDNVGGVLTNVFTQLIEALSIKSLISNISDTIQLYSKTVIDGMVAIINFTKPFVSAFISVGLAIWNFLVRIFAEIYNSITATMSSISNASGISFNDIQSFILTMLITAEWAYNNMEALATRAFLQTTLFALQCFGEITHFFSTLPILLTWFAANWQKVFFTMFDFTATVFINLGQNIRNIMGEIWKFISSGGTAELKFAWIPLTEGFKSAIDKLPNIPHRVVSDLEKEISTQVDSANSELENSFSEFHSKRMSELLPPPAELKKLTEDLGEMPKVPAAVGQAGKAASNFDAALTGSKEAMAHITEYKAGADKKTVNPVIQTTAAVKDVNASLASISGILTSIKESNETMLKNPEIQIQPAALAMA